MLPFVNMMMPSSPSVQLPTHDQLEQLVIGYVTRLPRKIEMLRSEPQVLIWMQFLGRTFKLGRQTYIKKPEHLFRLFSLWGSIIKSQEMSDFTNILEALSAS